MKITKYAVAGTLESSDAMVTVEPNDVLEIEIESVVLAEYGQQIRCTVEQALRQLGVTAAKVHISDRGALDCVLSARLQTAVHRGKGID
ncbi:MAG: citrate lyase acyl carrier protein [Oscillospiraceae bacterium]